MLLTYSVNGANLVYIFASGQFWLNFNHRSKVYAKLKIVLIKVQVLSKLGIVLFEQVPSTLLPFLSAVRKRIRPNTIIYLYISFQRSSLNVSPRIFRICPSIHAPYLSLSLSSYSHVSILDRMIENREREKEVRKSIGGRSRRGQACAQFHGKILIEDNRS